MEKNQGGGGAGVVLFQKEAKIYKIPQHAEACLVYLLSIFPMKFCPITALLIQIIMQNLKNKTLPMKCLPSLIRVFAVRMKKAWVLSYPLSTQQRLWSDRVEPRLIWVRWRTNKFVGFVMRGFNFLCCGQSQSITIHAKMAVNWANPQPYQLGQQEVTIAPFTIIVWSKDVILGGLCAVYRLVNSTGWKNEPSHEIMALFVLRTHSSNAHAQQSSGARRLIFGWTHKISIILIQNLPKSFFFFLH